MFLNANVSPLRSSLLWVCWLFGYKHHCVIMSCCRWECTGSFKKELGTKWIPYNHIICTSDFYEFKLLYWGYFFKTFWLHHAACGILVPQPGMEPEPPAVEAWSLNCWITREVPYTEPFKEGTNNLSIAQAFPPTIDELTAPRAPALQQALDGWGNSILSPEGLFMCEHLITLSVTLNFLILSQTDPIQAFPGGRNRPVVNCPSVTGMGTLAIYTIET